LDTTATTDEGARKAAEAQAGKPPAKKAAPRRAAAKKAAKPAGQTPETGEPQTGDVVQHHRAARRADRWGSPQRTPWAVPIKLFTGIVGVTEPDQRRRRAWGRPD
jgi:hypothetical protein